LKVAGAGVAATSLAGCRGSGGGIGDSLTIGVLAPGPNNDPRGKSIANAAKLAADQLNAEGGVLDVDVEVSIKDTEGNPSTGQSRYQDLTVGEQVNMTTGVFTSEVLENIMDDIAETRTVHITSGAATPEPPRQVAEDYEKYKYWFRSGPLNSVYLAESLMNFGEQNFADMGWERIAVLVENYAWNEPIRNVLDERLPELDANVVQNRTYAEGTSDFSPLFSDIEASDADGVLVAMAHTGNEAVVQWARGKRQFGFGGIHIPMQLPAYYSLTKRACAFTWSSTSATPQSQLTPKTQDFVSAYQNRFDSLPVYAGYHQWDGIMQYAAVAEELGTVDADEMVTGLEESQFTGTIADVVYEGPDGRFPHDLMYEPVERDAVYFQWQPNQQNPNKGTQQTFFPGQHQTSNYTAPPWIVE
jgi:branched-chain amino acid transport system substrate-binding protein